MGQIAVSGSLTGNPVQGSGFPSATFSASLGLLNGNKLFTNATGVLQRVLASAAAFVPLAAIGAGGDVPSADFFYLRSTSSITLRITQGDGSGGTTVQTTQVQGLFLLEAPTNKLITLVEVQGTGPIEYFASGS